MQAERGNTKSGEVTDCKKVDHEDRKTEYQQSKKGAYDENKRYMRTSLGSNGAIESVIQVDSTLPCQKCFVSHFPRPNRRLCKYSVARRAKIVTKEWPYRLKGGAGTQNSDEIIERGILNAKAHDINVHVGVRNLANGNCAFESVLDSINTRDCFEDSFTGTPDEWRLSWMTEVENVAFEEWNGGLTREEWHEAWELLKTPRTYEHQLGDLILPGIAHCSKKDILIFNTSVSAWSPIYVVESSKLCGQRASTEIPICLAYNQVHYEVLVPDTEEDILKTITLKNNFIQGNYQKLMNDIPFLEGKDVTQSASYASAVKRGRIDAKNTRTIVTRSKGKGLVAKSCTS